MSCGGMDAGVGRGTGPTPRPTKDFCYFASLKLKMTNTASF